MIGVTDNHIKDLSNPAVSCLEKGAQIRGCQSNERP